MNAGSGGRTDLEFLDRKISELYTAGAYAAAVEVAEEALSQAEARFGSEHYLSARYLIDLGILNEKLGAVDSAVRCREAALRIDRSLLAAGGTALASSLGDLAVLNRHRGDLAGAERLLARAIAVGEPVLGLDDAGHRARLTHLARVRYEQGHMRGAREVLARLVAMLSRGGPAQELISALGLLARTLEALEEPREAVDVLEQCVALQARIPGAERALVDNLNGIAVMSLGLKDLAAAERALERAVEVGRVALGQDDPDIVRTLSTLAGVRKIRDHFAASEAAPIPASSAPAYAEQNLRRPGPPSLPIADMAWASLPEVEYEGDRLVYEGRLQEAIALAHAELRAAESGEDPARARSAFSAYAHAGEAIGDYAGAYQAYQDYWDAARGEGRGEGSGDIARAILGQGRIHLAAGDPDNAVGAFENAMGFAEYFGASRAEVLARLHLARFHALEDHDRARENARSALSMCESHADHRGQVSALALLGAIELHAGAMEAAASLYQSAVERSEVADASTQSTALLALCDFAGRVDDVAAAARLAGEGLERAREAANLRLERVARQALARCSLGAGRFGHAVDDFLAAWRLAMDSGARPAALEVSRELGLALLGNRRLEDAEAVLERGIAIGDSLGLGLNDALRVRVLDGNADLYHLLQKSLLEQGKRVEALVAAERGRTRAFMELVATHRRADTATREDVAAGVDQIRDVARDLGAHILEYSFFVEDGRELELAVWMVAPQGTVDCERVDLGHRAQSDPRSLTSDILRLRKALAVHERGAAYAASANLRARMQPTWLLRKLYERLIGPVESLLPEGSGRRLIVVPQGPLLQLAFPALRNANGAYLIERFALAMAPSLRSLTHASPSRNQGAVVVGNPDPPNVTRVMQIYGRLPALPGAQEEAIDVARMLGVEPLIGSDAGRSKLLDLMPGARIIHIAAHGLLDYRHYIDAVMRRDMPGAIVLSSPTSAERGSEPYESLAHVAQQGSYSAEEVQGAADLLGRFAKQEGLLTAGDVIDLDLDADLVVLSGCDTGRGRLTSDGIVGLPRAFLYAGARSVVVSLWAVPDTATAALMRAMYGHLIQGHDKDSALRSAMLESIEMGRRPRDWAGFALMGRPD